MCGLVILEISFFHRIVSHSQASLNQNEGQLRRLSFAWLIHGGRMAHPSNNLQICMHAFSFF